VSLLVVDVVPVGVPARTFAKLAAVSRPSSTPPEAATEFSSGAGPVVAVVGATASGKSELALDLAERLGGEIVNTDSMQVYRGMDIGTAKLPPTQRRGITHHLLDVLDVTEPATVAEFQGWAREVIADCRERDVTPVLVGGSALYTRAILDRFEFPGTDPVVRARLEEELVEGGAETLHARLAEVDPAAAAQVLPSNGRRVVRALEVIEITGRPYSASLPEQRYHYDHAVQIGVDIDRDTLDRRIEQRVEQMWAQGFVDEVRVLVGQGLREGRTAHRALGYQQVLAFLDGELTEDEARERTISGTRRFARRQDSWFRKDPRITWVRYDDPARVERAMAAISAAG
jgi:tRNA dimethylallyltransferase